VEKKRVHLRDVGDVDWYRCEAVIVGSGAAGLNCAERLFDRGVRDIAVVTSHCFGGTSYLSGSDKQTYYKMSVFGGADDSPLAMAQALCGGGAMDGDTAYVESVCSLPSFFHLVDAGVPFPRNEFGAFVGYKTDHDPRQRATSAGPKTSRFMVECLLKNVRSRGIPILDRLTVVHLATVKGRAVGLVAIDERKVRSESFGIAIFEAPTIVLATGGPGELYETSVYPAGQVSMHGAALEAGVTAVNLGESQFGLASVGFRWNLSGTYQQVVPSYISGEGRRNFLADIFRSLPEMATAIFLKGYQWPFSAARAEGFGSSLIDIAVEMERQAGRRVFLDFLHNPEMEGERFDLFRMGEEAVTYLKRSGALQETPYLRLAHMNPEAIEIYREHDVDLRQPLEMAVCFQHNNGGLSVDLSWETDVAGIYAIGEIAGTHGVTRPGGSALNAGQVGGLRVADAVSLRRARSLGSAGRRALADAAQWVYATSRSMLSTPGEPHTAVRASLQKRMTEAAGFVRRQETVRAAAEEARRAWIQAKKTPPAARSRSQLPRAWETRNLLLAHWAFLASIEFYVSQGGGSRGSYLIVAGSDDPQTGVVETRGGPLLRFRKERLEDRQRKVVVRMPGMRASWQEVRPIPEDDSWFETVWARWRRRLAGRQVSARRVR